MSEAIENYVKANEKSRGTSFVLTLLLGPLGLLYSSVIGGVILIFIAIASAVTVIGPLICWFLSILIGDSAVVSYNKKVRAQAELMAGTK